MVTHCQADARRIIWDLRDSDEITNILSQALSRALNMNSLRENPEIAREIENRIRESLGVNAMAEVAAGASAEVAGEEE